MTWWRCHSNENDDVWWQEKSTAQVRGGISIPRPLNHCHNEEPVDEIGTKHKETTYSKDKQEKSEKYLKRVLNGVDHSKKGME